MGFFDKVITLIDNNKKDKSIDDKISDGLNILFFDKMMDGEEAPQIKEHRAEIIAQQNKPIDRRTIPPEEIDKAQQLEASEEYRNIIINRYYSDYPEPPFISKDRELYTNWIEQARIFPTQSIIKRSKMVRYKDGLLPGHVYMLYWLGKYSVNRRIPSYFEYDYGIWFTKEKEFLRENGYLDDAYKPTDLGKSAIDEHYKVIRERHPKPAKSSNISTIELRDTSDFGRVIPDIGEPCVLDFKSQDVKLLEKEFSYINDFLINAARLAKISVTMNLSVSMLNQDKSCFEYTPFTKTGRKSKYPLTLHFEHINHEKLCPQKEYFGEIEYLQNGRIGSARIVYWENKICVVVYLLTLKNSLVVNKIEYFDAAKDTNKRVLYKVNH